MAIKTKHMKNILLIKKVEHGFSNIIPIYDQMNIMGNIISSLAKVNNMAIKVVKIETMIVKVIWLISKNDVNPMVFRKIDIFIIVIIISHDVKIEKGIL